MPGARLSPHSQNVTRLLSKALSMPHGNGRAVTCQPVREMDEVRSDARNSWMRHGLPPSAVCTTRMARSGCPTKVKRDCNVGRHPGEKPVHKVNPSWWLPADS